MPGRTRTTEDDFGAFLTGAILVGVGAGAALLAAAAYQNNEQRRNTFFERLTDELGRRGFTFVDASFARAAGNIPVWNVTLRTYRGTHHVRVALPAGAEPYTDSTRKLLVDRVVSAAA